MNQDNLIKMLESQISRTQEKLGSLDKFETFNDHEKLYELAYYSTVLEAYQVTHKRITEQYDTLESCTSSILAIITWDKGRTFDNPFGCALVTTRTTALVEVAHQLHKWAYCYKALDECAKEAESLSQ
jgi:hypothetical protein